jgi:hypothetical protein
MPRVYTAPSDIHGTGVFAALPLRPGEIVLRIDDSRGSPTPIRSTRAGAKRRVTATTWRAARSS